MTDPRMDPVGSRDAIAPGRAPGWGIAAALALLAVALLLAVLSSGPPAPKPESAPPAEFSAGRAQAVLRELLGDGAPHPVGSPAAARVRERIVARLTALGLAPEVQEAVACAPYGACARVHNVIARLPGREPGKSVLLMAHYDSVGAGPGASDDLAGVAAILETARVLKAAPPLRHGVLLLLDEGEEAGLLGARAFAAHSPAMAEVGAAVNLDARGSSGSSLLFETSGPDAWMLSRFAAGAAHPSGNSLFFTLYQYLPNDTDLTVFKERKVPGLNFAFIDGPAQYHTTLDNLADASPASLQHHGDNAIAAVRGLADSNVDLASPPRGRAVFFDLFQAVVVRWPAGLSPLLGVLALALTLAAVFLMRRRGVGVRGGSFILGFTAPVAALIWAAVLALLVRWVVAGAFPTPWVARPQMALAAFWLAAFGGVLALAALMGRRASLAGLWAGVWILWSCLGLIVGLLLPGVSYLFLVPALVAGVCGLLLGGSEGGRTTAAVLPIFVAALLWFPVLSALYIGLGLLGAVLAGVLLAVVFSGLTPLLAGAGVPLRRWLPAAALVLAVILAVWARTASPYSPAFPQHLDVMALVDADSGESRWAVQNQLPFPPAMRAAAAFSRRPAPLFPWTPYRNATIAPAPRLDVPGPEITVLADTTSNGERHLRLRLASKRGAPVATLYVPMAAGLTSIRVAGEPVPIPPRRPRASRRPPPSGYRAFTFWTLDPTGYEVEIVTDAPAQPQPLDWYLVDQSYDLPPAAAALLAARPPISSPMQDGNVTLVSRKARI
jgi:hypothetical protein